MMLATSSSRAAVQVRRASGRVATPFRAAQASQRLQQRMESRRHAAAAEVETESKPVEEEFVDEDDDFNPSTQQVQDLLTVLESTEIAEIDLKIGGFSMSVKRNLKSSAAPVAAAPASVVVAAPTPVVVRSATPSSDDDDDDVDEGKIYVSAPKVGIFRRGRYAAGKRVGKGMCINSGDQVKKGQTLGFIEQLGTFIAVEAPQAGEVGRFLVEDGGAVEYQQSIVEISPFFGGHIIGDKKYA